MQEFATKRHHGLGRDRGRPQRFVLGGMRGRILAFSACIDLWKVCARIMIACGAMSLAGLLGAACGVGVSYVFSCGATGRGGDCVWIFRLGHVPKGRIFVGASLIFRGTRRWRWHQRLQGDRCAEAAHNILADGGSGAA